MARCKTDFLCNLKQVGTQLALILYLPLIFTFCGRGGAGSFGEQEVGGQGYVRKERNGPELGVLKGWEVGELGKIMQQCLIFCNPNRAKRWVRAGNARFKLGQCKCIGENAMRKMLIHYSWVEDVERKRF